MHPIAGQDILEIKKLVDYLSSFITEERYKRFREVAGKRTRHLTIVLEDIFQPHNASAVLRTCDCFGIQDVHIVEGRNKYQVNPDIALGSSKWLTLNKYNAGPDPLKSCLQSLREKGYRIIATSPHKDDHTPDSLPLEQKSALIFGTELQGLTSDALDIADDFIQIPMVGFTESLNISVSAAILLNTLTGRLRNSTIPWQLSDAESDRVLLDWLRCSINKADMIIKHYTP